MAHRLNGNNNNKRTYTLRTYLFEYVCENEMQQQSPQWERAKETARNVFGGSIFFRSLCWIGKSQCEKRIKTDFLVGSNFSFIILFIYFIFIEKCVVAFDRTTNIYVYPYAVCMLCVVFVYKI